MVHCRPETDECRSLAIDGRATFTIVLSRPTMNRLMQQMARMSRRRRRVRSGRVVHLDAKLVSVKLLWSYNEEPSTPPACSGPERDVGHSRHSGPPDFGHIRTLHAVFLRRDAF